jgi:hypothetical protein
MSAISLRMPKYMHDQLRDLAKKEGISINQFVNSAIAEKFSALMTKEYLEARAARGSRAAFDGVLDKAGDAEPEPDDRIH